MITNGGVVDLLLKSTRRLSSLYTTSSRKLREEKLYVEGKISRLLIDQFEAAFKYRFSGSGMTMAL